MYHVSIIIPAYNAEKTITLTLDSIFNQYTPPHEIPRIQVIVSDNGSTDKTRAKVEAFADERLSGTHNSLIIVDSSGMSNANYARNVGASHAEAEYLLFCDADDVVGYYWIDSALTAFKTTAVFSGIAENLNDSDYPSTVDATRAIFDWRGPGTEQVIRNNQPPVLMGGNFGITRKFFYELGGLDTSAPPQVDDDEFALRILTEGYALPILVHSVIGYRIRSNYQDKLKRAYQGAYARAWLSTVYYPTNPELERYMFNLIKTYLILPCLKLIRPQITIEDIQVRQAIARGYFQGKIKFSLLRKVQRGIGEGLTFHQQDTD